MAKKFKISKLMHNKKDTPSNGSTVKSAFNNHSQRIQKAKEKKIEKLNDTKNRIMDKKKENKAVKINSRLSKSHKLNKFALLDEPDERYQPTNQLTHKGTSLDKVKHFNDMNFDHDESGNLSEHFDQMHNQVNFHGFDEENAGRPQQGDRRKSKNQIYKQIIEKSKMHKRDRQEQYQQNFNAAVELDQEFPELVSKLKFRNNDAKVREKIQNRDLEYERLLNELKEDQRVVANRVVDNNKKGAQKIRKKKTEQLNELMRNSDDEQEEDIRGWVKGLDQESNQQQDDEENEDQIDEVELSSGDDEQEDEEDADLDEEEEEEEAEEDENEGEEEEEEEEGQEQSQSLEKVPENKSKKIVIKSASQDSSQIQDQQESESEQKINHRQLSRKGGLKNKQILKGKKVSEKKNTHKFPHRK